MTSSRLPGKVLMLLGDQPMLAFQLSRLKACQSVDAIVIATTTNETDDPLVDLARSEGVGWFRGSEHDVLSRCLGAAKEHRAEVVVRVTADCPFIDPTVSDTVIRDLLEHRHDCDYVGNVITRSYPRGLDTEAMFFDTLLRMDRLGLSKEAREH